MIAIGSMVVALICAGRWRTTTGQNGKAERRPVVIIKLGGSAITDKTQRETKRPTQLWRTTAEQIAVARESWNSQGVDLIVWQHLSLRFAASVLGLAHRTVLQVVHGAGSFGHFDAREYGVSTGTNLAASQHLAIGCSKTRRSVTRLNNDLLGALIDAGLPAVGISAFPNCVCRSGSKLDAARSVLEMADQALSRKLLPLCHGDVVLTDTGGCTILSGDTILVAAARRYKCLRVCWLTDVDGVFDRPPSQSEARLIPHLRIESSGAIQTDSLSHDVTGGIRAKLDAAIMCVRAGAFQVFIVKVGTSDAAAAMANADLSALTGTLVST
jgi:isopentenyl phosphate kinase